MKLGTSDNQEAQLCLADFSDLRTTEALTKWRAAVKGNS